MVNLIVFSDIKAASAFARVHHAHPRVWLTKLSSGRLIEVRLNLPSGAVEVTEEAIALIPSPGSALIVDDRGLEVLEPLLTGWDHVTYALEESIDLDEE